MSKNTNVVGEIKKLMQKFGFLNLDEFAKLVDGTEVKVEGGELKEGAAVMVVTEEGDVPAPDGTHEMEDGTKIQTEEGMIKKITESEKMKDKDYDDEEEMKRKKYEKKPDEMMDPKEEEKMEEEVIKVELPDELPAEIVGDAVESIIEAMIPILEKVKDLEEELKKVKASFQAFRNQPAGSPVNKTKKDFQVQDADELVNKILALKKAHNK